MARRVVVCSSTAEISPERLVTGATIAGPVRFEDFVLRQEETVRRLEDYLEMPLARIIVRPDSVGRWRTAEGKFLYHFFRDSMAANGYTEGLE